MKTLLFVLAAGLALAAAAGEARSQSVSFTGAPLLRYPYGPGLPVYNPGAIRLPASRPPYGVPPGLITAALGGPGSSPGSYVIGSPAWRARVLGSLPPAGTPAARAGGGFRYRYVYEMGPDRRYRLALRLVPR